MPPSTKELEFITDSLVRRLQQRADGRSKTLLVKDRLLNLASRIFVIAVRAGIFAGGLVSVFSVSTLLLNKWASLQNLETLLLTGILSTATYWLLAIRRFPLLAHLLPAVVFLWILSRGGI